MFRIGQPVVCVNAKTYWENRAGESGETFELVEGDVYHIRWIGMGSATVLCVKLIELPTRRPPPNFGFFISSDNDVPFAASRFRPLITTEMFMTMDAPAPKEKVDA